MYRCRLIISIPKMPRVTRSRSRSIGMPITVRRRGINMYPSMDFAQQIPSLADFARMRRSLMEHMGNSMMTGLVRAVLEWRSGLTCIDCEHEVVWMRNVDWHFLYACGCTPFVS